MWPSPSRRSTPAPFSPKGENGSAGRGPRTAVALAPHPHPSCWEWQPAIRGPCGHGCSPVRLPPGSPLPPLFSSGSIIPPRGVDAAISAAVAEAAADGSRGVPHCLAPPPLGLLVGAVCSFFSLALGFYRKGRDILGIFTTLLLPPHPHPAFVMYVPRQTPQASRSNSVEKKGLGEESRSWGWGWGSPRWRQRHQKPFWCLMRSRCS